ncbi:MAG: aminotransferase class V-fold PLP-dependent enzyme, partial [Gemmatimonadota bacterium]
MTGAAKIECQRDEFTLPDGCHYLNCAYMSPLSRRVQEAGVAGVRRKGTPADIAADDFFDDVDEARRLFAELVHVPDAGRIAVVPSASYAISTVARNTAIRRGQTVVTVRDQFPSNTHPWRRVCAEAGAEFRIVDPPSQGGDRTSAWNETLLEAIDGNAAVVTLGQAHWADGTPFDLVRIGERAREVGAAFVIDGTQSVGALPFNVQTLRPD